MPNFTDEETGPEEMRKNQAEHTEIKIIWQELAKGNVTNFERLLHWIGDIKPRGHLSEELAPPIDSAVEKWLRDYCRQELPLGQPGAIGLLTVYFKSWADAVARIRLEQLEQIAAEFRHKILPTVSNEH